MERQAAEQQLSAARAQEQEVTSYITDHEALRARKNIHELEKNQILEQEVELGARYEDLMEAYDDIDWDTVSQEDNMGCDWN